MRTLVGLAVAATLAAAAPARAAQEPPTITMSGAVPAAAVTADLAYFYRRSHRNAPRFDIVGGQTNTGIADAARGVSAVGLVTRALLPTDPPGLFFTPIARTGFCLVTHRTNPLPGITRALVQDLVAARVTSWAQVPGATRADAIVAATLPAGGGGRVSFETAFLDPATPQAYVPRSFTSSAQVRAFVLSTPSAWGYADLAFTNGLHTVPYEGIRCSRATVASQAYPASSELGFVTRGKPKGAVRRFIRWVRSSGKARRVIATRYVPVR